MTGVLLFIFILLSFVPFIIYPKVKLFLFRPDIIFSFAFMIYVIPVPLNKLYFDNYYKFEDDILDTIIFYHILFSLSFYLAFYFFTPRKFLLPPKPTYNKLSNKSISIWVLCFSMIISIVLYSFYLNKFGGIINYLSLERMFIYKNVEGLGIFSIGILFTKTIWIVLLSRFLMNNFSNNLLFRNSKYILITIILLNIIGFILFSILNLAIGDRRILLTLIIGIVGLLYLYRFISNKAMGVFSILLLIFFQIFSRIRHLSNNPSEMVEYAVKKSNIQWLDLSYGEPAGHYIVFNDILQNIEKVDKFYGLTYLKAPLLLVPSTLYPDRYEGLPTWFVNEFYPDYAKKGGGMAFSFVAETFINFGAFGPIFIGFLLGIILAKFWKITMFKYKTALSFSLYMLFVIFIITLPRNDFSSGFKELFLSILLPLGCVFIASKVLYLKNFNQI